VRRATPALPLLGLALVADGCGGRQSTLRTDSSASHRIAHLWWVMFIGSAIVFGVVTVLVLAAVLRSHGDREPSREDSRSAKGLVLLGGFLVPLAVLIALFVLILTSMPISAQPRPGRSSLVVDVTGHQWFWEVRYPAQHVVTANEIHIPAGKSVEVDVSTADVIHSFWVPGLNRKIDTIPDRDNRVLLRADSPGVYRGQCAEFCGLEHAKMAFLVFVDPPDRFRAWLANQQKPAATTTGPGEQVFVSNCAGCHTISGTPARGTIGPNLTHLASRTTIAAGTIPNNPGYLAGWILDPQHVKPGNKMPGIDLTGGRLQSLLQYLESLK